MKTNEIYKKGIEKFQKFHNEIFDIKFKGEGVDKTYYDIKRFIKIITLDILKADIKRLEKSFYIENDNVIIGALNAQKQDQIDYYQEQIKLIDE